jgi:hypothetical protein
MGNGAFMQGAMQAAVASGMGMMQPGGGGFDALYIGDLQWVRDFVINLSST